MGKCKAVKEKIGNFNRNRGLMVNLMGVLRTYCDMWFQHEWAYSLDTQAFLQWWKWEHFIQSATVYYKICEL